MFHRLNRVFSRCGFILIYEEICRLNFDNERRFRRRFRLSIDEERTKKDDTGNKGDVFLKNERCN